MLAKRRFLSGNVIDVGDDAPPAPTKSRCPPCSSPSSVSICRQVAHGEQLFRGKKILIEEIDGSSFNCIATLSSSSEIGNEVDLSHTSNPLFIPSSNSSCNSTTRDCYTEVHDIFQDEGDHLVEYNHNAIDKTRRVHDQPEGEATRGPTPDEARRYASTLLTESFRILGSDDSNDDDNDEEIGMEEEIRPLSTSPPNTWRRSSRRRALLARRAVQGGQRESWKSHNEKASSKSCLYLFTSITCACVLLAGAIAFFALMSSLAFGKDTGNSETSGSYNSTQISSGSNSFGTLHEADLEPMASSRFDDCITWLHHQYVTNLTKPGSPQYLAAVWIADSDPLQLDVPVLDKVKPVGGNSTFQVHNLSPMSERFLQRYSLALVFFALDGTNWKRDLNFLSRTHECSWFENEVGTDGQNYALGVTCNASLWVTSLFIVDNSLKGSIPSEMFVGLRRLELLSFRRNQLEGEIPSTLGNLAHSLRYLDLSKNSLVGTFPELIGTLRDLQALGLGNNDLHGTLMRSFGALSRLHTLDLGSNKFNGECGHAIGQLTNMEYLLLGNNQFEDEVNDKFLIHLKKLKELRLGSNKFHSSGELPQHLFSYTTLTHFEISHNFLGGSLPSILTLNNSSKLIYLDINSNNLEGTIPLSIQDFGELEYVDMAHNLFSGAPPVSLGNMKHLKAVRLGQNNFNPGPIPPIMFTILTLQELSLPEAHITGLIPHWIGLLKDLEYLDLRSNEITGSIPSELWSIPSLLTVLLSNNTIYSSISNVETTSQLEMLAIDNTAVFGNTSSLCETSENLRTFVYNCNKIECLGQCCQSECCTALTKEGTEQCFVDLLSTALEEKEESDFHFYQTDRAFHSFDPSLIDDSNN